MGPPFPLPLSFPFGSAFGAGPATVAGTVVIGVVSIEGDGPELQLGYWLAEPWHGRGFMTEAVGALVAHAFETRPLTGIAYLRG